MKQSDNFLCTTFFCILLASIASGQNFIVPDQQGSETANRLTEGYVVVNYDGENFTSIGDTGTTFIGGVRFRNNPLGFYTGNVLVSVQFYYAQPATGLTILIYDSGTPVTPGALLLSQTINVNHLNVGDWNQIMLNPGIVISGEDMWVCLRVEDSTAAYFPFGCDAGPSVPDGNWINDSGTWQHLTDFGLNYNWNIRGVIFAQPVSGPVIFYDNFDSYTPGQQLACQNPTDWTTWNLNPCDPLTDALISDDQAYSGANSFVVVPGNDEVHYWGPETSGVWEIDFYNFIPSGKSGYFNALSQFIGVQEWGLDVYFNAGGAGSINAGGLAAASFTYLFDTWVLNQCIIDLDYDIAQYRYNGVLIYMWQWTQGSNGIPISLSLAANDFYGAASTDEMYVDDYQVTLLNMYLVSAELVSFTANINASGQVVLNWQTASETNNKGFEVERQACSPLLETSGWDKIGFVQGYGTTSEAHHYSYVDENINGGVYNYRLNQIDFNGKNKYSDEIIVDVSAPVNYYLKQNYPNPFNPVTTIKYSIPGNELVTLKVYDLLGQEVAVLVNENKEAGVYSIEFNASSLSTGMYLYKLTAGSFTDTKKLILLK